VILRQLGLLPISLHANCRLFSRPGFGDFVKARYVQGRPLPIRFVSTGGISNSDGERCGSGGTYERATLHRFLLSVLPALHRACCHGAFSGASPPTLASYAARLQAAVARREFDIVAA
jgi:hypothetical protein